MWDIERTGGRDSQFSPSLLLPNNSRENSTALQLSLVFFSLLFVNTIGEKSPSYCSTQYRVVRVCWLPKPGMSPCHRLKIGIFNLGMCDSWCILTYIYWAVCCAERKLGTIFNFTKTKEEEFPTKNWNLEHVWNWNSFFGFQRFEFEFEAV
jgi:hypothetical protein